jgi:hypothetical protein
MRLLSSPCRKLARMDEPKQKRKRVEREEWAKRVGPWRNTGLTTAEFAVELARSALKK